MSSKLWVSSSNAGGVNELTSDTSLELVYPPDDGRYTGGGRLYLETDMVVVSMLTCVCADTSLTLYLAREGPRRPHEGGHKDPKRCSRVPGGMNRVGNPDRLFLSASPSFPPVAVLVFSQCLHLSSFGI